MLIKRFEGGSLPDVIRQVRAELGPDAIVLSQRTRPPGRGWLGLKSGGVVEVTAAIDRDHRADAARGEAPMARPDESWRPLQLTRALMEPLEDEIRSLREIVDATQVGSLAEEVDALRRIARDISERERVAGEDPAAAPYLRAGLAPHHADLLGDEARRRVAGGADEESTILDVLSERIEERLAAPRVDDSRSQLIVGAPGVGKTTTLAKEVDRVRGADVVILSADPSRPGASEPLRVAAGEMGVGFQSLDRPEALSRGPLRSRTVFIDTPGFASYDGATMRDLCGLRAELGRGGEVQLVLAATTKEADLRRQLEASRRLKPDVLVVSRIDETSDLANIINVVLDPDTPRLAWLGCGQAVPHDLRMPDARDLARSVLENVS